MSAEIMTAQPSLAGLGKAAADQLLRPCCASPLATTGQGSVALVALVPFDEGHQVTSTVPLLPAGDVVGDRRRVDDGE